MKLLSRHLRSGLSAVLVLLFSLVPPDDAAAVDKAGTGELALTVVDWQSGVGLAGAGVQVYYPNRGRAGFFRTGTDGVLAAQLAPGSYLVTAGFIGYEAQVYDGVVFTDNRDLGLALDQGTLVVVPENGRVDLAPMRLRKLGQISGRILDAASGEPIGWVTARVFKGDRQYQAGNALSGDDGYFTIADLPPGTYYLMADGQGVRDLLVGGDEACVVQADDYRYFPGCDPTRGTPFTIGYGETADAGDIRLPEEGRIRGTVRLDDGRASYSHVQIYNSGNRLQADFYPPGAVAEWTFDLPVPGGSTFYVAALAAEHLVQVYDHLECIKGDEPQCTDYTAGTAVTVAPGQRQSGIDFDLQLDRLPCRPSATTLCLNDGRFTVSGYNNADRSGGKPWPSSQAGRITEEAGYFTFFDPDNVELVVKVLDACDDFGAFWVFAAGLTDVNNILYVRDNWAAKTQRYDAHGNRPYRPFLDSTGFRTCFYAPPEPGPEEVAAITPAPAVAPLPAPQPATGLVPNGCGSDPDASLCLGDRFAVEVEWATAQGETGDGKPQPLTADTGFFHFFSPGNIEVVVKVLDACRPDLGNRYWVFAAGMTDVAVTLTVTDTATGEEKIYLSPLGGLFQPILDLTGFAGCP